jgi:predicted nucleotidyltransferase
MSMLDFYIHVTKALDEIGAPYMIVGAFGGTIFGITRATNDVDIIVDLHDRDFEALSKKFPLPRYYADPEMIKNSVEMGIMFNIIDSSEGVKADLVPLKREPEYQHAFARRIRETFTDENDKPFEAWVAQPTDIIIGKLQAWDEGRSDKHPKDIFAILFFCLSGYSDYEVNLDEVTKEAARIGSETLDMWNKTLARAKEELEKGNVPRKW